MRRDHLRELAQLVRFAEPDGTSIGPVLAEHASELAHLLQSDERELKAAAHERDDALVDRLRVRLEMALDRARLQQHEHDVERAQRAACVLARTSRWFELGVVLDVDIVLGDLLAGPHTRFIAFALGDTNVTLRTATLRRVRPLLREYMDLACFVDERGIHFRWKAGRGQLNFYDVDCHANDGAALIVQLPPRLERRAMLIGDVLAEMGLR